MLTNLFASDEKVFLQFPVSHPFSYLTNWMQFSTRSLHKRFVQAAQKKPTNLADDIEIEKNGWKLLKTRALQTTDSEPKTRTRSFFLSFIRWKNSSWKMIVTGQWNETTLARILTRNCFYFDLIFIFAGCFFWTDSCLLLANQHKMLPANVGALNGECTLIRWYAFT